MFEFIKNLDFVKEMKKINQNPTLKESDKWTKWKAVLNPTTCEECVDLNGTIREEDDWRVRPPIHNNCRCVITRVLSILAGTLTNLGNNGADWYIKYKKRLPSYYILKSEAYSKGWKKGRKNTLDKVAPGKMIGGDVYRNRDNKLPQAKNRIWYEADFDYIQDNRNKCRIVYSNDGLIFASFDHFITFHEIR